MWGLLDYEDLRGRYNEGDYIQSLAAAQYLPRVDKFISRERLSDYQGARIGMILNGWFMNNPNKWPPSPDISPLITSFHINRPFERHLTTDRSIDYLKGFRIGCRDVRTAEILSSKGVDAYYSGCLTLTLGKTVKRNEQGAQGEILLVDVAHAVPSFLGLLKAPLRAKVSHLRSGSWMRAGNGERTVQQIIHSIPRDLHERVSILTNVQRATTGGPEVRLAQARARLDRYAKASLVITSRIHTALPCLAIGTPVIFLKYGQRSLSNIYRFKGIIDLMNVIDLDGDLYKHGIVSDRLEIGDIDFYSPPANPEKHLVLAEELFAQCSEWVRAGGK